MHLPFQVISMAFALTQNEWLTRSTHLRDSLGTLLPFPGESQHECGVSWLPIEILSRSSQHEVTEID